MTGTGTGTGTGNTKKTGREGPWRKMKHFCNRVSAAPALTRGVGEFKETTGERLQRRLKISRQVGDISAPPSSTTSASRTMNIRQKPVRSRLAFLVRPAGR